MDQAQQVHEVSSPKEQACMFTIVHVKGNENHPGEMQIHKGKQQSTCQSIQPAGGRG